MDDFLKGHMLESIFRGISCVYLVIIVTKLLSHQLTTHHNCPYSARVESLLLCAIHWTM